MADNCGYQVIDVTATDHAFDGIPADAEAGKTLIRITNDGTEYHEVVLQRVHQGETRSVEELLALPEEEGGDLLDYLGNAFAPAGLGNWTVVDLSAGRHVALCFIPTGATTPRRCRAVRSTTPRRRTPRRACSPTCRSRSTKIPSHGLRRTAARFGRTSWSPNAPLSADVDRRLCTSRPSHPVLVRY